MARHVAAVTGRAELCSLCWERCAGGAGAGWGWAGRGMGGNCALLGLVLGQSLLVIKPHSTGVLPLGLNTESASETSLIV